MGQRQENVVADAAPADGTTRTELCDQPGLYALQARGLSFVRSSRVVFQGVDLAIAPGEIVGLLGSNGVGKTTLLRCLAGASRPTAGEVTWRGEAAGSCPAARRLVGFLGHESGLYRALTAWENLLFAGRMCGIDHVGDRAAELLSSFGLHRQAQQTVGRLSRGMRQRLAIARAVIHDPPILLLDEPFTSLDASGRCWLVEFLCGLRQRSRAILLATHEAAESRCFADRLLGLHADGLQGVWRASELGSASLPRKTSEVSKTSEVF